MEPRNVYRFVGAVSQLLAVVIAMRLLLTAGVASAAATIQDINPDNSSLDATDPDAASGGRVNGLAAVAGDNQTLYAAAEFGGLYKSTDAGLNWFRLDGHLPTIMWDVEVDPSNTGTVYATSFYDGRVNPVSGIQVSYDAGVTWAHPTSAHPDPAFEGTANDNTPAAGFECADNSFTANAVLRTEPSAFGIGIRPDAANNVFIGTNCGVARSTDSGATWQFVDPTPGDSGATRVWDVVVQGASAGFPQGIVDICGDDRHLRSTDGGNTWTGGSTALPAGRCSIAVSPDESYVLLVYAADNNLYESDDGGTNWTIVGTPDRRRQGRVPFVVTNQRSDAGATNRFDIWAGDVSVFSAGCTTPTPPAAGGALRCPLAYTGAIPGAYVVPAGWNGPFTRDGLGVPPPATAQAHDDVGDVVFDSQAANDACPTLYSSDGGVYRNTDAGADCQNPDWEQPDVTPHALWIYGMDGADQPGDTAEDLYFGLQDDGTFATTDAGAASPTWLNRDCCDSFDIVADSARVVSTLCCGFSIRTAAPGMVGNTTIGTNPPGNIPGFAFPDFIDQFGANEYIAVTASGAFTTGNITAGAVTWTQLGVASTPAGGFCAVKTALSGGTPTFYALAGNCTGRTGDQLWQYTGAGAGGTWQRVDNTDGLVGGIGIFAVDPNNPNRLYASNLDPAGPQMVFSTDGGATWNPDPDLDNLMTGGGAFKYQTARGYGNQANTAFHTFVGYPQPSLLAFDPENPNIIVAGGRDSGVFVSFNGGQDWGLATDPLTSNTSGIVHLPRPWFAYFDHEPAGQVSIYVGTQGRGVWRLQMAQPTLSISKTLVDPPAGPAGQGDLVTFRIEISNVGTEDVTSLPLDDIFDPRYLAYESASVEPDAVVAGLVEWDNLTGLAPHGFNTNLAAGDAFTVDVTFRAIGCPPEQTTTDKAVVSGAISAGGSPLPPVSATATVDISCPAVAVLKTLDPVQCGVAGVGETVTFTIAITNTGNATIDLLPLQDTYDGAYLAYTGATPISDDNADDGVIDWADLTAPAPNGFGADLAPGSAVAVVANFTAEASTGLLFPPETVDAATVSGATDPFGFVAPDASSSAAVKIADADLWVTKEGPAEVFYRTWITYKITYGNDGPDTAQHVRLRDILPAGTSYVSDTLGNAKFPAPGEVEWFIGPVLPGNSYSFELTVRMNVFNPGDVLTDEIQIESGFVPAGPICGTPDSDPTNNQDTVDTVVKYPGGADDDDDDKEEHHKKDDHRDKDDPY